MFLLSSLLLLLLLFFVSRRVMTAAKKPKNVKPKSGDNDAAEKKIGDLRCKTLTGGRTKPVSSPATNSKFLRQCWRRRRSVIAHGGCGRGFDSRCSLFYASVSAKLDARCRIFFLSIFIFAELAND